jgi:hypothetical protein
MASLSDICTPAALYLILSIIALVWLALVARASIYTLLLQLIFIGLWTYLLNFLCVRGLGLVSWVLVLLPYILFIFLIFLVLDTKHAVA